MPLNSDEKERLEQQSTLLAALGEPESLVATLRQTCERKARSPLIAPEEANRWAIAARALLEAEATINAAQSPEARKLARHMEQWPAQDQGAPKAAPEANQTP